MLVFECGSDELLGWRPQGERVHRATWPFVNLTSAFRILAEEVVVMPGSHQP